MPPVLQQKLLLDRCPHCSVNRPNLELKHGFDTRDHAEMNQRRWCVYICNNCGGVVTAAAKQFNIPAKEIYPSAQEVDKAIPEKAREYLRQSIASIHAPSGAVMLAASSVDAMLKEKNYIEGSLYKRIEQAVTDHLITTEMAQWAHEVRLDANDQRHADEKATLPTESDAQRVIDFVTALGQFMFVLPQMIKRGIEEAKP